MAESPMVGARVPKMWQQQFQEIALSTGRKEAEIIREALGQYLGQTDPAAVKGALADLQERMTSLERKLASLGRLVRE